MRVSGFGFAVAREKAPACCRNCAHSAIRVSDLTVDFVLGKMQQIHAKR